MGIRFGWLSLWLGLVLLPLLAVGAEPPECEGLNLPEGSNILRPTFGAPRAPRAETTAFETNASGLLVPAGQARVELGLSQTGVVRSLANRSSSEEGAPLHQSPSPVNLASLLESMGIETTGLRNMTLREIFEFDETGAFRRHGVLNVGLLPIPPTRTIAASSDERVFAFKMAGLAIPNDGFMNPTSNGLVVFRVSPEGNPVGQRILLPDARDLVLNDPAFVGNSHVVRAMVRVKSRPAGLAPGSNFQPNPYTDVNFYDLRSSGNGAPIPSLAERMGRRLLQITALDPKVYVVRAEDPVLGLEAPERIVFYNAVSGAFFEHLLPFQSQLANLGVGHGPAVNAEIIGDDGALLRLHSGALLSLHRQNGYQEFPVISSGWRAYQRPLPEGRHIAFSYSSGNRTEDRSARTTLSLHFDSRLTPRILGNAIDDLVELRGDLNRFAVLTEGEIRLYSSVTGELETYWHAPSLPEGMRLQSMEAVDNGFALVLVTAENSRTAVGANMNRVLFLPSGGGQIRPIDFEFRAPVQITRHGVIGFRNDRLRGGIYTQLERFPFFRAQLPPIQ